jgi:hypothetical protein
VEGVSGVFAETEIDDFDMIFMVDEDILRFQIAMAYTTRMAIMDSFSNLLKVEFGLILCKMVMFS